MRGRASEIVETLASRRSNICAFFSFFFNLLSCISVVPAEEMLLVCCDLNGHVGKDSSGLEGLHGRHGYGARNPDGTRILELCVAADLVITNTFFTKCDSQLLTFRSGNACSQNRLHFGSKK